MNTHTSPDQAKRVTFTFEGRTLTARKGQSIASALMASGTHILTRSFKYRRPRGYTCGFDACGNCPITRNGLQGVSACATPVEGGETVVRERGWPSADHDIFRGTDLMSRYLPAGFQFRLFRKQPHLSHQAEKVMAQIAGAGRFPTAEAAAAQRTQTSTDRADILVVGGGISGCAAALGAADAGGSVTLAHRGLLGGRGNGRTSETRFKDETSPAHNLARQLSDAVTNHPRIKVVNGIAIAHFETGVVPVIGDGQLIECHPQHLIAATGSYDVPALFPGNDKPGIVLADGVSRMLLVDKVSPWRRAVVLTDSVRGYELARQLRDAGVEVAAIIDQSNRRTRNNEHVAEHQRAPQARNGRILAARGTTTLKKVDAEANSAIATYRVDLLCIALTPRPADDLARQWHYVNPGTPTAIGDGWTNADRSRPEAGISVVGSAANWPADDPDRAYQAGIDAAAALEAKRA